MSNDSTLRLARTIAILCLVLFVSFACGKHPQPATTDTAGREFTDEAGRKVILPARIDRVVSLAPNLTEIVFAVGAGDRLVGNTEYCDYPAQAKSIAKIGDTMHPSIERIIALKPQLVLVSTASQLEVFTKQLTEQKISVFVTNPRSLNEVFQSMSTMADLMGTQTQAAPLVADLRKRADAVESRVKNTPPVKVFYQVSGEPLYTIGRDAFLTDLVHRAGGVSVTKDLPGAFPRYSDESALASHPDAIILPTGGSMGSTNASPATPLKDSPAVRNNHVYKINDDHLSRPGPRLVDGLEEMARAPEQAKAVRIRHCPRNCKR